MAIQSFKSGKTSIRTWYVHFSLMCVGLLPSEDTSYWVSY